MADERLDLALFEQVHQLLNGHVVGVVVDLEPESPRMRALAESGFQIEKSKSGQSIIYKEG